MGSLERTIAAQWRFHARPGETTHAISLDGKCLRARCEQNHDLGHELLKRFAPVVEDQGVAARYHLVDVHAGGR